VARRVFFSFHYENDIWRAQTVKNSWVTAKDREQAGFWNASLEEEAKTKGDAAVKKMIDEALKGASVTAVLIGSETASRKYVLYEIEKSYADGMGILGIYIHQLKNSSGVTSTKGANPLDSVSSPTKKLSAVFKTYDWVDDNGYENLGSWVEAAAKIAGR
jgi:hypothetical protein